MNLDKPSGRLGRWILELQQMVFEMQYRKGTLNHVADALSTYPRQIQHEGPTTSVLSTVEEVTANVLGLGNTNKEN